MHAGQGVTNMLGTVSVSTRSLNLMDPRGLPRGEAIGHLVAYHGIALQNGKMRIREPGFHRAMLMLRRDSSATSYTRSHTAAVIYMHT